MTNEIKTERHASPMSDAENWKPSDEFERAFRLSVELEKRKKDAKRLHDAADTTTALDRESNARQAEAEETRVEAIRAELRPEWLEPLPEPSAVKTGRITTPEQDAEIERLYRKGTPVSRIANEFGISRTTIDKRLKAAGLKVNAQLNRY